MSRTSQTPTPTNRQRTMGLFLVLFGLLFASASVLPMWEFVLEAFLVGGLFFVGGIFFILTS